MNTIKTPIDKLEEARDQYAEAVHKWGLEAIKQILSEREDVDFLLNIQHAEEDGNTVEYWAVNGKLSEEEQYDEDFKMLGEVDSRPMNLSQRHQDLLLLLSAHKLEAPVIGLPKGRMAYVSYSRDKKISYGIK